MEKLRLKEAKKVIQSCTLYKWQSQELNPHLHWRRKWQPTPLFLPGEFQAQGSLVGCHLWGRTESDTIGATQQQQQQEKTLESPSDSKEIKPVDAKGNQP